MKKARKGFWGNESGAVAVYVAVGLVAFLGCAALALDIAHLVSVKRELVKAAEAGALSGARGLWPQDLSTADDRDPDWFTRHLQGVSPLRPRTRWKALTCILARSWWRWGAGITPPNSLPSDISANANAVRVTTWRNNVQMILAQILGQGPEI